MPALPLLPGPWNLSLVGGESLGGNAGGLCVRPLCRGSSLTRCLFGVEVAKENTRGQRRMLEHSPRPFPPPPLPPPGRWRGRDTCAAARSRGPLRAALRARATAHPGPRSPREACSGTFRSVRRTGLPSLACRPGPGAAREAPCQPWAFSGLPTRKLPPAQRTSSPGLRAYENVTQLIARVVAN